MKPSQARAGDVISIAGAGDDMTDLDFTSDRCTWFQAGRAQLVRVERPVSRAARGDARRRERRRDESVLHSDARQPTLEDLGLSEEDLAQMDERQNTADDFDFDGKSWQYHLSREVKARPGGSEAADRILLLGIPRAGWRPATGLRKAEGEPFGVTLYKAINPGDITIYRGSRT